MLMNYNGSFSAKLDEEETMLVLLEAGLCLSLFALHFVFSILEGQIRPSKPAIGGQRQEGGHRVPTGGIHQEGRPARTEVRVDGQQQLLVKILKIEAIANNNYLKYSPLLLRLGYVCNRVNASPHQLLGRAGFCGDTIQSQVLLEKADVIGLPVCKFEPRLHSLQLVCNLPKSEACETAASSPQLQDTRAPFLFASTHKRLSDNGLASLQEEVGGDFLGLPRPAAGGVDLALEVQQFLVRGKGRLLVEEGGGRAGAAGEGEGGEKVVGAVLGVPLEEVQLALAAPSGEGARADDVLELLPVPAAATLLLLLHD